MGPQDGDFLDEVTANCNVYWSTVQLHVSPDAAEIVATVHSGFSTRR